MGRRALHPAGPRQPGQLHARPARRRAALRRRHQLRQRDQRLHQPGAAAPQLPDDDAGRVRRHRPAAGTRAVHAGEPRLDRHAGRRDLRQRRRRPALQRRALPENGQALRSRAPGRGRVADRHRQAEGQGHAQAQGQGQEQPAAQGQEGQAQAQAGRRPLRLCHVPQLRRPQRSRGADHDPQGPLPLPDPAGAEQGGRQDDRPARPRLGPAGHRGGRRGRPVKPGASGSGAASPARAAPAWALRRMPARGCSASTTRCPTRSWSAGTTPPAATRWR